MTGNNRETVHYGLEITGRVQGVGFRYSAQNEAGRLGVRGYVKNMSDGSVSLEIEGYPEKVNAMISWCNTGPRMARVERVGVFPGKVKGYTDFSIR
jgi:acylphosphatase